MPDAERQFQPRARKLWIAFDQEAAARIVVAAVPQGVEFGRKLIEIESDPVRLVGHGRAFDDARILRRLADQREFLGIEPVEVGATREINASLRRLALERADPRMGILDVEDRIVLRRLDHLGEVEVERRVGARGSAS